MRKNLALRFAAVFALMFLVSFVSAEIFLEQPRSIYNLGDDIILSAAVDAVAEGYFSMELVCENGKILVVRDIPSSTIIRKNFPLTSVYINDLRGSCYVTASYDGSSSQTQSFTISNRIDAYLELDKKEFSPSESVLLSLDANKATGEPVSGFASIVFPEANVSLTKIVSQGKFSINFSIPYDMPSGTYSIKTEVYEKDKQGETTNQAFLESNVFVKQEARRVEVVLEDQEATPDKDFKFKILVYDQSNDSMKVQVRYSLLDGNDEKLSDLLVESEENIILSVPRNESPGYRTVVASTGDLSNKRFFYVPEVEKVNFEVMNTSLKITNVGNVHYRKNVEIGIGPDKEVVELSLGIDQSANFNLQAPQGSYDIGVTDGIESFAATGVALTGNSVKVVDLDRDVSLTSQYSLVWFFIIGVLGLFIFGVSRGLGKEKFMAHMPKFSKKKDLGNTGEVYSPTVKTIKSSQLPAKRKLNPKEAQHSLVIKGNKEFSTLLSLRLKNYDAFAKSDYANEILSSVKEIIKDSKGTVYEGDRGFVLGIFSPSSTHTFHNEVTAVKAADKIQNFLKTNNARFKSKVDYGLGVHCGDLVIEVDPQTEVLKFTSISNTTGSVKKISESASNEVLISEALHRRTAAVVKTRKRTHGDLSVYEIMSITDREENAKFINDFLSRQKK